MVFLGAEGIFLREECYIRSIPKFTFIQNYSFLKTTKNKCKIDFQLLHNFLLSLLSPVNIHPLLWSRDIPMKIGRSHLFKHEQEMKFSDLESLQVQLLVNSTTRRPMSYIFIHQPITHKNVCHDVKWPTYT